LSSIIEIIVNNSVYWR